jgi:hypothetical protein
VGYDPQALAIRHLICPVTLIINIYGLGEGISTIKKFTSGGQIKCLIVQAPGVIPHPLPEVNFLMVEIPTPKPYIFMIRVTRQIKCLIAHAWGSYPTPYLR